MRVASCVLILVVVGGGLSASAQSQQAALENKRQPKIDKKVMAVISELDKFCRKHTVYMVGPEKAQRLAELVREQKPQLVVECGTALGYSGLWIAGQLRANGKGKLVTIELDPERARQAAATFERAGLSDIVQVKVGDARQVVRKVREPVDFVFIDCNGSNYLACFEGIEGQLTDGAMIVADNAGISAASMSGYLKRVRTHQESRTEWFDIGLPWANRDALEITVVRTKASP